MEQEESLSEYEKIKSSQAVLDIFLSHDLKFLTMVGWVNRHKETQSYGAAEKEIFVISP